MSKFAYLCPESFMQNKIKIVLVGLGGTGGEVLDILVRFHFALLELGHPYGLSVSVYDGDTVSPSNIGRQRFYECDIGRNKAVTAIERLNMAYGLDWSATPIFFNAENVNHHFIFDLLITCTDQAQSRTHIQKEMSLLNYDLWLDFGNGSKTGQFVLGGQLNSNQHQFINFEDGAIYTGTFPNALNLFSEMDGMVTDDQPSCSMADALRKQDLLVNRSIATIGMQLIWQLLRQGRIENHGGMINLDSLMAQPILIDDKAWGMFGYQSDLLINEPLQKMSHC